MGSRLAAHKSGAILQSIPSHTDANHFRSVIFVRFNVHNIFKIVVLLVCSMIYPSYGDYKFLFYFCLLILIHTNCIFAKHI